MTNLNKEKEEIIYELLLSLNKGNSCYASERVEVAISQYNALIENKIITEWCEHDWRLINERHSQSLMHDEYQFKCSKCGKIETRACPF